VQSVQKKYTHQLKVIMTPPRNDQAVRKPFRLIMTKQQIDLRSLKAGTQSSFTCSVWHLWPAFCICSKLEGLENDKTGPVMHLLVVRLGLLQQVNPLCIYHAFIFP